MCTVCPAAIDGITRLTMPYFREPSGQRFLTSVCVVATGRYVPVASIKAFTQDAISPCRKACGSEICWFVIVEPDVFVIATLPRRRLRYHASAVALLISGKTSSAGKDANR